METMIDTRRMVHDVLTERTVDETISRTLTRMPCPPVLQSLLGLGWQHKRIAQCVALDSGSISLWANGKQAMPQKYESALFELLGQTTERLLERIEELKMQDMWPEPNAAHLETKISEARSLWRTYRLKQLRTQARKRKRKPEAKRVV